MNRFLKYPVINRSGTSGKGGFSIIELLVVMSAIALLVVLAIPAMNAMQKSLNSGGAESMISAALATARTLAIKNGHYTGVRFPQAWKSADDPLKAQQYMIFVVFNDDKQITNWDCGFIAIEGYKPIKLPENVGVIDKIRRRERASKTCNDSLPYNEDPLASTDLVDGGVNDDPEGNNRNITDISTFSIVFSPSGKLVTYEVRCRGNLSISDTVFNTKANVDAVPQIGMFYEDNQDGYGIGVEMSRTKFYIYDPAKLEKMPATGTQRWDYLNGLKVMNINPYTGEIIK